MRGYAQSFPQCERFLEPCRDFVEEPPRALVEALRRTLAALRVGFLAAVFLAPRGLVAEAGAFLAGRLPFPGFDAGAAFFLDSDAAFFLEERLLLLTARGFTRAPTNAVAALDATFMAASTFALAALAIASCADGLSPSFSLSIVTSLCELAHLPYCQLPSTPQPTLKIGCVTRAAQQLPVRYHLPSLPQVSSRPALQTVAPRE